MSQFIRAARRLVLVVPTALLALALAPASALAAGELIAEPDGLAFGELAAGEQRSLPLSIRNLGPDPVTLGDLWVVYDETVTVEPFALDPGSCSDLVTLDANASCEMTATFTAPQQSGTFEAAVVFEGEGVEPAVALLTGTALPAGVLSLQPSAIVFPRTPLRSTSAPESVTVRNVGGSPIAVPPVSLTNGDFRVASNTCPPVLGVGADCVVGVVFAPAASRTGYGGHLVLGPRSSWTRRDGLSIPLSGTVDPPLSPTDPAALIESVLGTLSDSVPRALRGGPRHGRLAGFTAAVAGTLRLRVYGWPGKGRILVASGERKLAAGERRRLRVTLTKKGRKLLRRPKRSRVKVVVSFTAAADGAVSKQSPEYTVKRPKPKRPVKRK